MPRYNHAYTIAFEVISNSEDAGDVTEKMLVDGIFRKLHQIFSPQWGDTMLDACDHPYDTYEIKEDTK